MQFSLIVRDDASNSLLRVSLGKMRESRRRQAPPGCIILHRIASYCITFSIFLMHRRAEKLARRCAEKMARGRSRTTIAPLANSSRATFDAPKCTTFSIFRPSLRQIDSPAHTPEPTARRVGGWSRHPACCASSFARSYRLPKSDILQNRCAYYTLTLRRIQLFILKNFPGRGAKFLRDHNSVRGPAKFGREGFA